MLLFPNCKINIGLNVIGRRNDGYHDLETIFYPIYKLYDAIEVLPQAELNQNQAFELSESDEPTPQSSHDSPFTIHDLPAGWAGSRNIRLHLSGLAIEGKLANNLCLKAYQLLKQDFPELPPVDMCLHKAIPMGAGLGGGSADGAFTLQLLNQKFNLNLHPSQLLDYALRLGSDCPFFIINKPRFGHGRGDILEPVVLNLTGYAIVIIHPGIHVSTAQAFAGISPRISTNRLQEMIVQPIETWRQNIQNDFEETVFALHPVLQQIKTRLYEAGAVYAAMSGSGSALYGIYSSDKLPTEHLYPNYFERHLTL